jgi:transposase
VVWSDECSVEKSRDPRQVWVFRTPPEKWYKDCVNPRPKGKGISLMVWGCFYGRHRGTFCPLIVKSVDSHIYLRLLQYCLTPVMQRIQRTLGDPVFMQDNAPIHKAHIVLDWFDEIGFDIEEHPPYSPDLNPIEHVWVELKKRLQIQYPKIGETPGGPEKVKQRLAEVLPLVWETIPEEFFENLWRTMPHRVEAVIKAKGWYTKY